MYPRQHDRNYCIVETCRQCIDRAEPSTGHRRLPTRSMRTGKVFFLLNFKIFMNDLTILWWGEVPSSLQTPAQYVVMKMCCLPSKKSVISGRRPEEQQEQVDNSTTLSCRKSWLYHILNNMISGNVRAWSTVPDIDTCAVLYRGTAGSW